MGQGGLHKKRYPENSEDCYFPFSSFTNNYFYFYFHYFQTYVYTLSIVIAFKVDGLEALDFICFRNSWRRFPYHSLKAQSFLVMKVNHTLLDVVFIASSL